MNDEAGFTLIEIVCALAIVALLAALVLPALPRATSQSRLAGYAVAVAALLKGDRNAAIRNHVAVATKLDADRRIVRSGARNGAVEIPADVTFAALLAERCSGRRVGSTIDFFPSGASCGGVIDISRHGAGFQVRVNWLTGGVAVEPIAKP
ncbi:MAG: prepilin-type N-terminal cleavage/methylation domain-containing protein [Hyphomicrobiales bacterium]|nr:prepilin-type N-terminal cleavage/methylation domain-containing protein [Hyphomicrobiales bacterium]